MPGGFYHVLNRGNNKQALFRNAGDYVFFLNLLETASKKWPFKVHAYCLMPNHYHLFMETTEGHLSRPLHLVNRAYAAYFARKYEFTGHVFQGRFKSLMVEKEGYLLTLSRYIHLNPIKAKLAQKLEDYSYSSYACFMGLRSKPNWLDIETTLSYFGSTSILQQEQYKLFVLSEMFELQNEPFYQAADDVLEGKSKALMRLKKVLHLKTAPSTATENKVLIN